MRVSKRYRKEGAGNGCPRPATRFLARRILAVVAALLMGFALVAGVSAGAPPAGAFVKAYGWGVSDGASKFEICTSTCQAGQAGGGAGQLYSPTGVATDPSGDVYVAELVNHRLDEFSAAGAFVKAYGWGVSDGASRFETCTG